jgi:predicted transcriptional regulator
MNKGEWDFLSNHGLVIEFIAKHPKSVIQEIAYKTGLSIAGVNHIIRDLETNGYITRLKMGRCNQYVIHAKLPMRHRLNRDYKVEDFLNSFGCNLV